MDLHLIMGLSFRFLIGLVLLTVGAEGVVRGGSRLAAIFGIPPLIIGLTIVSLGTSAPELAVSVDAALRGEVEITIGNIIGSNIANLLLILGLCAAIAPLPINKKIVSFDTPFLIAVSLYVYFSTWDREIGQVDGIILLAILVGYTFYLVQRTRSGFVSTEELGVEVETLSIEDETERPKALLVSALFLLGGGAMLSFGADLFVGAASETARLFGVSQLVVGLTVVAVGTSLPEVATSVLASMRGELDIAVGNVVGSCIFNILFVLGAASTIHPIGITESIFAFDIPVLLGITLGCWPIFLAYMRVSRGEGVVMLGAYVAYLVVVVLRAKASSWYPSVLNSLTFCLLPLLGLYILSRLYSSRHQWLGGAVSADTRSQ